MRSSQWLWSDSLCDVSSSNLLRRTIPLAGSAWVERPDALNCCLKYNSAFGFAAEKPSEGSRWLQRLLQGRRWAPVLPCYATADKTSLMARNERPRDRCPFSSKAVFARCGCLHVVPRPPGAVGKGRELPRRARAGPGSRPGLAGGPNPHGAVHERLRLPASWIPLEYLTHSQPTSNPGAEPAPFISTRSPASSVLSRGCKLPRHFLSQVLSSRKPGRVGWREVG